jgi:hypothetical protein
MVKFKAKNIRFSTIHARVLGQEGEDLVAMIFADTAIPFAGLPDVVVPVPRVVISQLLTRTLAATNLSRPASLILEIKLFKLFLFSATGTSLPFHARTLHEVQKTAALSS